MDPQQRQVLEVGFCAIADAGYNPMRLPFSDAGAFVGRDQDCPADLLPGNAGTGTGQTGTVAANRISYVLGLLGSSMMVDTACSSALVAADLAYEKIVKGRCGAGLASGILIDFHAARIYFHSAGHVLSADGRCKTYDASAHGFLRAEGCGGLILQVDTKEHTM